MCDCGVRCSSFAWCMPGCGVMWCATVLPNRHMKRVTGIVCMYN